MFVRRVPSCQLLWRNRLRRFVLVERGWYYRRDSEKKETFLYLCLSLFCPHINHEKKKIDSSHSPLEDCWTPSYFGFDRISIKYMYFDARWNITAVKSFVTVERCSGMIPLWNGFICFSHLLLSLCHWLTRGRELNACVLLPVVLHCDLGLFLFNNPYCAT